MDRFPRLEAETLVWIHLNSHTSSPSTTPSPSTRFVSMAQRKGRDGYRTSDRKERLIKSGHAHWGVVQSLLKAKMLQ